MTPLSPLDRAALLGLARRAILAHLGVAPPPELPETGALAEPRGAFVTVRVAGELRGCIGNFRPGGSLARTVAAVAVSAAHEDPRFRPLGAGEVGALQVSISALGPSRRLADPRAVRIGTDGLIVKQGWHRGALLPHVAVEHGWDAETFLRHACLKASLPASAWEEPGTEVEAFEADEFGEEPAP
ncbi:MAG TPA: AmmeMemoRadiSam system protein A [Anaeromyxobacter sp.]|nr:AmmeMemoRadiSam system protein A [Anaeromyxobacter sp.]